MNSKTFQQLENVTQSVGTVFVSGTQGRSQTRREGDWFVPKLVVVLALSAVLTAVWYAALAVSGIMACRWLWSLLF